MRKFKLQAAAFDRITKILYQLHMSEFGNKKTLKDLYDLGRLTGLQTLWWRDIGGTKYNPVEVTITDTEQNPRGTYWMCDIDEVFNEGLQKGDTALTNPNLPVLKKAFAEMAALRKSVGQESYKPSKAFVPKEISALFAPENT